MFSDETPLFPPNPFWFASEDLLNKLLRAAITKADQLFTERRKLSSLFDVPGATFPERHACFMLLAHRKIIETISDIFVGRELSPSLSKKGRKVLRRTQNLFAEDAPRWVLDVNDVVELLPSRIYKTLKKPLRRGGLNRNDPKQLRAFESARKGQKALDKMQTRIGRVLEEQWRRLEGRWAAASARERGPNKRKGWEQRIKLYETIRRILRKNPKLEGMAFCAALDKHHAKPLVTGIVSYFRKAG